MSVSELPLLVELFVNNVLAEEHWSSWKITGGSEFTSLTLNFKTRDL